MNDVNATDHWYQKYLKEKLTWKDVAIIITIYEAELESGKISRYEDNGTSYLKEASEMILKRFNELRKK